MKTYTLKDKIMLCCIAVPTIIFFAVALRFFTVKILAGQFAMDNGFTRTILFDIPEFQPQTLKRHEKTEIDWAARYPFAEKDAPADEEEKTLWNFKERLTKKFDEKIRDKANKWTNERLMFYHQIAETGRFYERALNWYVTPRHPGGNTSEAVPIGGGYFSAMVNRVDMREYVSSVLSCRDFCREGNIDFLYVQTPQKIGKYDDPELSGVVDFTNQNGDDMAAGLKAAGADFIDIREEAHKDLIINREMFFKTDHHWQPRYGLWATGKIVRHLNEKYNFGIDEKIYAPQNYKYTLCKNYFLGNLGHDLTLAKVEPEDFMLVYPDFPTDLTYQIPTRNIDKRGDFLITYNMEHLERKDYYNLSPYEGYNYSNNALTLIRNNLPAAHGKILLVKDSNASVIAPFLALGVKNIDIIDMRHFTGSLRSYIKETKPDMVIMAYNIGAYRGIDWRSHKDMFDFR